MQLIRIVLANDPLSDFRALGARQPLNALAEVYKRTNSRNGHASVHKHHMSRVGWALSVQDQTSGRLSHGRLFAGRARAQRSRRPRGRA